MPMGWIVSPTASGFVSVGLAGTTESAALAAFHEHGCVLLRGAYPLATVEAMHGEYVTQCGWLDSAAMQEQAREAAPNRFHRVGNARYEVTLQMTGVFGTSAVFGNSLLLKFIGPLLGGDMHL